ncbi:MAG: flagellar hook-basal body complex protein [Pseudomonadota bacterium]
MSLSSSLNAGVAGLSTNSTRLAAISDNIANASTAGYKRTDVEFSSLVTPSADNTYSAGGVRVNTFRDVRGQGTIINTGNATDITVTGRGLLTVTLAGTVEQSADDRPFLLASTGSFSPDEDGFLVTTSGLALTGWPTDAFGNVPANITRDSPSDLEPVRIAPFLTAAEPTTSVELGVNLPARETEDGALGDPFESPIEYFDSVGRRFQLRVVYTPNLPAPGAAPSDSWNVSIFDSATSATVPISEYTVDFDSSRTGRGTILGVTPIGGAAYDVTTGIAQVTVANGPIEVFLGAPTIDGGLVQLDAEFAPTAVNRNGSPAGSLANLELDENGFLQGVYDTGQRVTLYRIPLADVPNPNGLIAEDNQAFSVSPESGDVFLWDANGGPVGGISGFAIQQSTVDVARELTDLIQTQRAYSSNATVIQTVDEMLQETTNIKR